MSTIDDAKNHLMMTIGFITSRSNEGSVASVDPHANRGGIQPRHDDDRKGEEGVVAKPDESLTEDERGLGIARRDSDAAEKGRAEKVDHNIFVGTKETGKKEGEAAPSKKSNAVNLAHTGKSSLVFGLSYAHVQTKGIIQTFGSKTKAPDAGKDDSVGKDTDQARRALGKSDYAKHKGDPIGSNGTFRLSQRRSSRRVFKMGNVADVHEPPMGNDAGKHRVKTSLQGESKKSKDILSEELNGNFLDAKKSASASQTNSSDEGTSQRFYCPSDGEQSDHSLKNEQNGTTWNGGGNKKTFSKEGHSTKYATQVSSDDSEPKNGVSAFVGGTTTAQNLCDGAVARSDDAMNEDFSLAGDDWDELSTAAESNRYSFSVGEQLGAIDDFPLKSKKTGANQTHAEGTAKVRSQEKEHAPNQCHADVTNEGIQGIATVNSNNVTPSPKSTERQAGPHLCALSKGWTLAEIPKKGFPDPEKHYKSPKLKLEFKSYIRAHEFDCILAKHPKSEEAAAIEYMHKIGGYKKLMNYVCNLNRHTFLQNAKVLNQNESPVKHSLSTGHVDSPEESALLAAHPDSNLVPGVAVNKPRRNLHPTSLCSRGWRSKTCSYGATCENRTQWLSPELQIKFRFAKAAEEFDEICQQYNCNEEQAWDYYVRKLMKQCRKIGAHVVGGRLALEFAKSRTLTPSSGMNRDKSSIEENDDACYVCEEGGELICCDYCEKAFHLDCHIPRLLRDQIPSEKWKCCECKAPDMPLSRCGECKDCMSACEPRPLCKHMRFAEPESSLFQGKRKSQEQEVHGNKRRKMIVAPAVVDDNRPRGGAIAEGPKNGGIKGFEDTIDIKQRQNLLISKGWTSKPGYHHHIHWVSPKRKLEFVTTKAAEEFEEACQACMGDEEKASILYMKRVQQQGRTVPHYVVGGASALTSFKMGVGKTTDVSIADGGTLSQDVLQENAVPKAFKSGQRKNNKGSVNENARNDEDSEDLLLSQGWVKVAAPHQRIKRYLWVSPNQKLQFKSRVEATMFNSICQENNEDEVCALSIYTEKIKLTGRNTSNSMSRKKCDVERKTQRRRLISRQPAPKIGSRRYRNISDLPRKGPRPQKTRIQESLGPGWARKAVFCKTQWRTIYESPSLGIQFKFLKDANLFHSLQQKNRGDESQTWGEYTNYKRSRKCPRNVINLKEVNGLLTSPVCHRKTIALSTINTEHRSPFLSHVDNDLTLNSEISSKQKSHAESLLAALSVGWSQVHRQYRNGAVVHFKSPQHGVEFKSFNRAKAFDDVLRVNANNESVAFDDFIRQHGRKKFRSMVCSLGTYKSQGRCPDPSITSTNEAPAEFCPNTDPHSDESSVNSSAEGNIVDEDYWEIEKVVAQRYHKGRMEYLVRWKGCSSKDDTWEPAENLCDSAIEEASMLPNSLTNDPKFRESLQKVLRDAIISMKEIDQEKVFHHPVTDDLAPEYSTYITEPMCLSTMEEKVMSSEYKTIEDFTSDCMLMFSNCIKYNNDGPEGWWYQKEAERQRRLYKKQVYQKAAAGLENLMESDTNSRGNLIGSLESKSLTKFKSANPHRIRRSVQRRSTHSTSSRSMNNAGAHCSFIEKPRGSYGPLTPKNKIGSKMLYSVKTGQEKLSFFSYYFAGLVKTLEVPFGDATGEVEKTMIDELGNKFELLSCKVPRKVGGSFRFSKQPGIEFLYINTHEKVMQKMNIQKELEDLCSFGSLDNRKVIARLGHLQSEAAGVIDIECSDIEIIEERGHEGCGFVPPNFFLKANNCPYKMSDALQVRIVAPKLGLIKGMLLVKKGIERIQIPESMIKVRSSNSSNKNWATVIFKKLYAPSLQNKLLGRLLDPEEDPPNSFKNEHQRKLSGMYQRILIGYGVPKQMCDDYVKRSMIVDNLMHTHLMGVADPTGCIPYGKVFIPGYAKNPKANNARDIFGCCLKYGKVFISRSPCLEPTDAKILSVIKIKPTGMSAKDWENLCSYAFGTVIFGLPKAKDDVPLPCLIADGDLDGDLYFVLWDEEILGHILHPKDYTSKKALSVLTKLEAPEQSKCYVDKTSKLDKPYQKKWFLSAQNEMIDVKKIDLSSRLVGCLYRLCQKYSQKDNGFFDIYDEDAIAFAQAYKDSMDVQKHGGKVYLPAHLHTALPQALRDFLTTD